MTARRGTQRPGGRTERIRKAVVDSVQRLIRDGNLEFTVSDVANIANVGRSTIHSRWPTRSALIIEILQDHNSKFSVEVTGDWETDIRTIAYSYRDFASDIMERVLTSMLITEGTEQYRDKMQSEWEAITNKLAKPFEDLQKRGKFDADFSFKTSIRSIITCVNALVVYTNDVPDDDFMDQLIYIHARAAHR